MTIAIVIYLLIGYFVARATAAYTETKTGLTWHDNFWTTMAVILMPFIWLVTPLLLLLKYGNSKLGSLAAYAGKELANPKENV